MITIDDFTRINNDINGNPRYVFHFLGLIKDSDTARLVELYDIALQRAKKIGWKKYHTKNYGGGIVIQSYNLHDEIRIINELLNDN